MFFQFAFEVLKQGEGIGGGAGETGQDLIVIQAADLAGIALHNGFAKADLAITADHDTIVAADRQDGGSMKLFQSYLPDNQGS